MFQDCMWRLPNAIATTDADKRFTGAPELSCLSTQSLAETKCLQPGREPDVLLIKEREFGLFSQIRSSVLI